MRIRITFYSYFRELTGQSSIVEDMPPGCTVAEAYAQVAAHYPRLGAMANSTLVAVGVEYQPRNYVLQEGDELALFPPVQGG